MDSVGNAQSTHCLGCSKRKTVKVFAKINIAIGLLVLVAAIALYGLEGAVYERIDQGVVDNQRSYRMGKISEDYYLTQLKQTTFLTVATHFSWMIGLVFCVFMLTTNIILLLGLRLNRPGLICYWLIITMVFNISTIVILCGAFVFGTLLLNLIYAILFLVISFVFFILPSICLWYLVYKLYKQVQQEQIIKDDYSIVWNGDNLRMIKRNLVVNDCSD